MKRNEPDIGHPDEPEISVTTARSVDPHAHPWIVEMRQYEPIDEAAEEVEAWF